MDVKDLLAADRWFGPILRVTGLNDFTRKFEDSMFSIFPISLFIIYAPLYIQQHLGDGPCVEFGFLMPLKLTASGILFCADFAILVLWTQFPQLRLETTLASSILDCFGALFLGAVLYVEHRYSPQPSLLIGIYLSITMLLDVAKARSYFLREELESIGALATVAASLKFFIILLEEVPKSRWIDRRRFPFLSSETVSGFWNRSLFLWLNSTLVVGFKRVLTVSDLPDMSPKFNSEVLHAAFDDHWQKEDKTSKYAIVKAGFRFLFWDLLVIVTPRLCQSAFVLAQPLLLLRLVKTVKGGEVPRGIVGGLCGASALIYVGAGLSKAIYLQFNYRVLAYMRGTLITALYNKSLRLSHETLKESSFLTLMSVDIEGIEDCLFMIHDIWASIIEFGVGIFILASVMGPSCVFVLVPTAISTFFMGKTTTRMAAARRLWNEHTGRRVATTSDILGQLKGVRVSGFTEIMSDEVQRLRDAEIRTSLAERWVRITMHATGYFADGLTPVVVLAGAFFLANSDGGLSIAEVFTILSVVIIITDPLTTLLMFLPRISGGYSCAFRIQEFLLLGEVPERIQDEDVSPEKSRPRQLHDIKLSKATLQGHDGKTIFENVNFSVRGEQITMIIGPVGCGKSCLLRVILGELQLSGGTVAVTPAEIAYCDQDPWLQNMSIRDNIIAQSNYNSSWYKDVLHACALDEDLKQLSEGDQTVVGTNGCNLSGGQRQRVALARACYVRPSIMLLDDPFSALDIETSRTILERLFGKTGILRQLQSTVLLATSSTDHVSLADHLFAFTDQRSVAPTELDTNQLLQDSELLKWLQSEQEKPNGTAKERDHAAALQTVGPEAAETEKEDALRRIGDMSIYYYYIRATGWNLMAPWLFSMALAALADRMPGIFLRIWMSKDPQNYLYFIGYGIFGLLTIAIPCIAIGTYYLYLVPRSSVVLHDRLLFTVMKMRLWFFTHVDTGSIVNRFSSDMAIIFHTLPKSFMQTTFMFFQVPTDIGIIVSGAKYAAGFVPFLFLTIYFIQFFYLRTSRQLRLLDLEARASLVTHFSETAAGIQHVRAFHWQRYFVWQCLAFLDYSQRPYYYMFCIQAWLNLVLDLTIAGTAVLVVGFALSFTNTTSEAALGLSMVNIITLSSRISGFLRSWVDMETALGAISRSRDFIKNTPIETIEKRKKVDDFWPQAGRIVVRKVTASYNCKDLMSHPVVQDVSFKIRPGDKVGIVGRTGSGKSSMMLTLLNFLDYTGSIKIDGEEISTIPHEFLRRRMISISQEGIQLTGSLRKNLDPYDHPDLDHRLIDETLIDYLKRACLWETIQSRGYDLDVPLKTLKLSTGQLQLLAVARAMLRRDYNASKIIFIDEAISSVDSVTSKKLQETMDACFGHCTVITIAHRLETVEKCGLVLEMADGKITRKLDRRKPHNTTSTRSTAVPKGA